MDDSTLFELWKEIYHVRLMVLGCASEKKHRRTAGLQGYYLEHTIDRLDDGLRKDAALAAFREVAFRTPRSREFLRRIDGK